MLVKDSHSVLFEKFLLYLEEDCKQRLSKDEPTITDFPF